MTSLDNIQASLLLLSGLSSALVFGGLGKLQAQESNQARPVYELIGPTRIVEALSEGIDSARTATAARGDQWTTERQQAFVAPYAALMVSAEKGTGLTNPVESLSLGEFYFLTFQGNLAKRRFEELSARDDLIGQHAADRLLAMAFATSAEDRWNRLESYERRFPSTPYQIHQMRNAVFFLLSQASRSDADEARVAGEKLLAIVEALPTDAPYSLLQAPVQWAELLRGHGLEDEARRLVGDKLKGLRALQAAWAAGDHSSSPDPILTEGLPIWYWRTQGIRHRETFHAARERQLTEMIDTLDKWLRQPG